MIKNTYTVIMAGGIGSRFWPLSRVDEPKQFLDILGTGKSLLTQTFDRFAKFLPAENIFVISNSQYEEQIKKHLPRITDAQILLEPFGKNTAACVSYACNKINHLNPNANIIIAPSDHLIQDFEEFKTCVVKALKFSQKNNSLLTLGIKPHRPDTGYGYIQFDDQNEKNGIFKVRAFTEKPPLELAEKFVSSGDFLWNAGIFIWSAKSIIAGLEKYLPEVQQIFEDKKSAFNTPQERETIELIYSELPFLSIDNGLLEKADNVYVLPADFGWSDLGTWKTAYELIEEKGLNKAVNTTTKFLNAESNLIISDTKEKLIVLVDVKDLYVIDTKDALLICDKSADQKIKTIVTQIGKEFDGLYN